MTTKLKVISLTNFFYFSMYTEEWKKSKQRYLETFGKKVEALGFDNPDTAVITALEKLISEPELKSSGK